MEQSARLAIIDNSIDRGLYRPVEHWSSFHPAGLPVRGFQAPEGELPGDPAGFSHYIVTGSAASILERGDWAEAEADFLRRAFRAGAAILGSCYGHQLLAYALFGPERVGRCPSPEVGWLPVEILADSDFLGPAGTAYAFCHHADEGRSLPPGCTLLARSAGCGVQAFGVDGRNVWGLQIHPEIDVPTGRTFLRELAAREPGNREANLAALAQAPRDSGLISRIVNCFIAFSS